MTHRHKLTGRKLHLDREVDGKGHFRDGDSMVVCPMKMVTDDPMDKLPDLPILSLLDYIKMIPVYLPAGFFKEGLVYRFNYKEIREISL